MNLRTTILAASLLTAVSMANLLDTNDVKMNATLGLGGNPAAIAVNQQRKVEGGTIVMNRLKQNERAKNPMGIFTNGKDVNASDFDDSTKFVSYTDSFADNWFSVRYRKESNLYPNFTADIISVLPVPPFPLPLGGETVSMQQKDSTETTSLLWARELAKGFTFGAELASNTYVNKTDITIKNSPVVAGTVAAMGLAGTAEADAYLSLTLGGIYSVADNQKLSISHKLTQERDIKTSAGTKYTEHLPVETGLAYIYSVNDALEVAGVFKAFWGTNHTDREILPGNSLGFAASYQVANDIKVQGYGNWLRNFKAEKVNGVDDKGFDVSQIGGNIQYSPGFFNGGTILLGCYMTRLVNENKSGNMLAHTVFDITNTTLSYSHAF